MSQTYMPLAVRRQDMERAHDCCEYCRTAQEDRAIDFVIDHIIAEKHGGQTSIANLCLSCYWCNSYKGSDLSSVDWDVDEQIVPLFNPRQQNWNDHFNLDGSIIKALTATGRVTSF